MFPRETPRAARFQADPWPIRPGARSHPETIRGEDDDGIGLDRAAAPTRPAAAADAGGRRQDRARCGGGQATVPDQALADREREGAGPGSRRTGTVLALR